MWRSAAAPATNASATSSGSSPSASRSVIAVEAVAERVRPCGPTAAGWNSRVGERDRRRRRAGPASHSHWRRTASGTSSVRLSGRSHTPSRRSAKCSRRIASRRPARVDASRPVRDDDRDPPLAAPAPGPRGVRLVSWRACRPASAPGEPVDAVASRRSRPWPPSGAAPPAPSLRRCRTARTSARGRPPAPPAGGGRAAGSPSPTGPRAAARAAVPGRTASRILRDCCICCNHRNIGPWRPRTPGETMVPDPTLLVAPRPGRAASPPIAKPVPEWREELRRIPSWRNALTVVLLYAMTVGVICARGLGEQPGRLGARVPRDGPGDLPLQHPHARGRAPAAVRATGG